MCNLSQEQGACSVLRNTGAGESGHGIRNSFHRLSDESPVQVDPKYHWHHVWYVAMYTRWRKTPEYSAYRESIEISAICTVVWYTYRNKRTLKLSALARVLVTEATVYFLVMVAAQIYIQLSFNLVKVWSLSVPASFPDNNLRSLQGQQLSLL